MNEEEFDEKYLPGTFNRVIRYYFYLENGLTVLNEFRNLFLGIIGIYIALKLDNVWWMIGMAGVSVIILTVVGYYTVHKISKIREWLNIRFSTHYGLKSFNYSKGQYETLEQIRELLKEKE